MTPRIDSLMTRHIPDRTQFHSGEGAMLPDLMRWLIGTGRVRERTRVALEVPVHGRRVDVATMTSRGVTSAFELKIGSFQRALEQAAYNRSTFHRSWVVTANMPKEAGLGWARRLGVGVIVIKEDRVVPVLRPAPTKAHPAATRRLVGTIAERSELV